MDRGNGDRDGDVVRLVSDNELALLAESAQGSQATLAPIQPIHPLVDQPPQPQPQLQPPLQRRRPRARAPRAPRLPTGFPSPAEDMAETSLDLNDLLVRHPPATFFVVMVGDALRDAGILAGDMLVVDRAIYPMEGMLVVFALDGHLTARYYCPDGEALHLLAANPAVEPITLLSPERYRYDVWGAVTGLVRLVRRLDRHQ